MCEHDTECGGCEAGASRSSALETIATVGLIVAFFVGVAWLAIYLGGGSP